MIDIGLLAWSDVCVCGCCCDCADGGVGVGVGWLFGVVLCGLLVSLSVGTRGQWARYGST